MRILIFLSVWRIAVGFAASVNESSSQGIVFFQPLVRRSAMKMNPSVLSSIQCHLCYDCGVIILGSLHCGSLLIPHYNQPPGTTSILKVVVVMWRRSRALGLRKLLTVVQGILHHHSVPDWLRLSSDQWIKALFSLRLRLSLVVSMQIHDAAPPPEIDYDSSASQWLEYWKKLDVSVVVNLF